MPPPGGCAGCTPRSPAPTSRARRYHALDPEPFAWVHTTLVDGFLLMLERYYPEAGDEELDRGYAEMRSLGSLYGVAEELMPADRGSHYELMERMVAEELSDNQVFRDVLEQVGKPPPPRVLRRLGPLWRIGMAGPGHVSSTASVGLLPERLRERLGLRWSKADERRLERHAAVVRRVGPLLPDRLRLLPSVYRAKRRR